MYHNDVNVKTTINGIRYIEMGGYVIPVTV